MIAVDTNLLVYAHRGDSPWHEAAAARITELAEDRTPWAIPWPCLHEFVGVVTHPRIAALCRLHGVRELWTADRDFGRFSGLRVRNPLVA